VQAAEAVAADEAPERPRPAARTRPGLTIATASAVTAAAAVAAITASARPTGLALVDAGLRAAFVVLLAVAAARARRWTWIVVAAPAAALAGQEPVAAAAGFGALVLALIAAALPVRRPALGAIAASAAGVALLHLDPVTPDWLVLAVTAAAVTALVVSAARSRNPPTRGLIARGLIGLAVAIALAGAGLAVAAAGSAGDLDEGMARARAGTDAVARGDRPAGRADLEAAAAALHRADERLNAWYTRPARLVPVLGQQAGALGGLAAVADQLGSTAVRLAERIDAGAIGVQDATVDIGRIRALEEPTAELGTALADAERATAAISTDWLVPPIRRRHEELTAELARRRRDASTALAALRAGPGLLGADGPRRYFVGFTTPAESRGLGGMLGSFAILTTQNGHVELSPSARTDTIERRRDEPSRPLDAPADYVARYGASRPQDILRDVTQSPDFPAVAGVIRDAYTRATGAPIDGVILADPYVVAAVLRLTGPVHGPGVPQPLTAESAADYLLRGQYERFGGDTGRRTEVLGDAARSAFDALVQRGSVEPARWAATLGPVAARRRLLVSSTRPDEQRLFGELGLDGAFPAPGDGDVFGMTTTNLGRNKLDAYLHRSVSVRAVWDPTTGSTRSRVTISLRNDAPDHGLPAYVIRNRPDARLPDGTNWTAVDLYSSGSLVQATTTGAAGDRDLVTTRERELGVNVYRAYVAVPAQGTVTIRLDLGGGVAPGDAYHIRWHQQPSANEDDDVTITVNPVAPWTVRPSDDQTVTDDGAYLAVPTGQDGDAWFRARP
jgi:hypothetical protein